MTDDTAGSCETTSPRMNAMKIGETKKFLITGQTSEALFVSRLPNHAVIGTPMMKYGMQAPNSPMIRPSASASLLAPNVCRIRGYAMVEVLPMPANMTSAPVFPYGELHGTAGKVGEEAAGSDGGGHDGSCENLAGVDICDGKRREDSDRQRQFGDETVEDRLVGIIKDPLPF